MALTLIEAAKRAAAGGEVVRSAVIEMFAKGSDLLRVLPFDDIAGNALRYNREEQLPGVAFRGVNESFSESTGVINPIVDVLAIAGGDLDVDIFIIKTMGADQRSAQEAMKIKALAQAISRVIIKGDSESDPREFDGLQKRLVGSQLLDAGATAGGDALSLAQLDALIDAVPACNALHMNKAMRRRLTTAARNPNVSGYINYTKDEFGRRVTTYNDIPILVPYEDNGGTEYLAFDEANPGGGANVGTSIYAMALAAGMVQGIQSGTMEARDLGEQNSKPVMRTRVEWYPGLTVQHGRAAARLRGIKDAAVVA
jgi:hypothetical protein